MSVYVDNARIGYLGMKICHMIADTPEELHAMAVQIGVKRRWYQDAASSPHYDIVLSKRALAVSAGAIEIDRLQLVKVINRVRPLWPVVDGRWQ